MELKKGTSLLGGKYRIERTLGQGSFGITYLAKTKFTAEGALGSMTIEAQVAIKEFFMSDVNSRCNGGTAVEGSTGSVFTNYRKKFKKEAQNLASLSHPNIVKVLDVFDENNTTYYVMEFIEGENLDDYIKRNGHLSEKEAIAITKDIGSALSYMHSRNMLHLDIKPKNIMRNSDGVCRLIDFGLSKQFSDNGEPESSTTIGLGTPGYAPIEQASHKQSGTFPATLDVYALGATVYKMLTGKRPPEGATIIEDGFPRKELEALGISERMIAATEKAMAPFRKNRHQTIAAYLAALTDTPTDTPTDSERTSIADTEEETEEPEVASVLEQQTPEPKSITTSELKPDYKSDSKPQPTHKSTQIILPKTETKLPKKLSIIRICAFYLCGIIGVLVIFGLWQMCNNGSGQYVNTDSESVAADSESVAADSESVAADYTPTGTNQGYDYVDLGLSVKWATCNVGASSPSDYGDYYAWGETSTKSSYDYYNSKTREKSMNDISGNPQYDVARYRWGGSWRLPTKAECQELVNKCTWTWTTQGGHNGCKVTSKINGKSIFLPAAGSRYETSLRFDGEDGNYWSSTPYEGYTGDAYDLDFGSSGYSTDWHDRYYGYSVRPVVE